MEFQSKTDEKETDDRNDRVADDVKIILGSYLPKMIDGLRRRRIQLDC